MLWYVIQTFTGREEQLVKMIRKQVPADCYGECFVAYYEQLRDRRQENQIHILRLFPGYIFISSDDAGRLFRHLKTIPAMTRIIASGEFAFTPLYEGEAEFLLNMLDRDRVVRLTYVATDGHDHVTYMAGPLERCVSCIRSYQFRKREAQVCVRIAGEEKVVRMGILLNDDVRREMAYGKVEARIRTPEKYRIPAQGGRTAVLDKGDNVTVIDGAFEGKAAVVRQVKPGSVLLAVSMFGREIPVEVPAGSVRRLA